MASLAASSFTTLSCFAPSPLTPRHVMGLPTLRRRTTQISCSTRCQQQEESKPPTNISLPSIASSAVATTFMTSYQAFALVDDRLSTEGTGLSLGLSNPLLIWILLGVTALIWALYFAYTSTLPDSDDDSGLAL